MAQTDILTMNSHDVILGNGETDSSTEKKDMSIRELFRLLTEQNKEFLNDVKTAISGTVMVKQGNDTKNQQVQNLKTELQKHLEKPLAKGDAW